MPTPALVATQLTDRTARSKRLSIGGLDVLAQYGSSPYKYMTDSSSIRLTENGPGAVSSLSFTIVDPLLECTFATDSIVEFWDIDRNRPYFLGFIQNVRILPTAVGRDIVLDCIGVEALLDWMVVPAITIAAGTWMAAAVQSLAAQATGTGFALRAFTQPAGSEDYGSQEYPIAGIFSNFPTTQYDVELDGSTLRDAIAQVVAACNTWYTGGGAYATIDFYGGLRLFNGNGPGSSGILTMSPSSDMDPWGVYPGGGTGQDPITGTYDMALDMTSVVRGVYIKGANAAGSGLVSDGSGITGPVAYLADDSSTTTDIRNAIGLAYLGGFSQSVRASATFAPMPNSYIDSLNYRPGSYVVAYADGQVMGTTHTFSLFSITKTFRIGDNIEDWTISFGGLAPSATAQSRRLTRSTRS